MIKILLVTMLVVFGYFAHNEGYLDGTIFALHPSMELDLGSLSAKLDESELLSKYPELDWDCYNEKTAMGDRVCTAPIRTWNQVLAKYTAFFFNKQGRLNLVKFAFREVEHTKVISALENKYGQSKTIPGKKDINGKPMVVWLSGNGITTASENVEGDGEATMTWMSGRAILEKVLRRMMNG